MCTAKLVIFIRFVMLYITLVWSVIWNQSAGVLPYELIFQMKKKILELEYLIELSNLKMRHTFLFGILVNYSNNKNRIPGLTTHTDHWY